MNENDLKNRQQDQVDYMNSEQAQRDAWEHIEDLWEAKARKEGWTYKRRPFISALARKQQAELTRQQEIAHLEERLKTLKGEP